MGGPEGPLGEVATALAAGRTAAQVIDAHGRLAWVSEQMLMLAGADDDTDVGYGEHVDEVLERPLWRDLLTPEAVETLRHDLHPRLDDQTGPAAPLWVLPLDLQVGARQRSVGMLGVGLRHADGSPMGAALIYAPLLPARVLALVSEGDEAMFTRMADLSEPAQRPAAIVFADVDSSGPLSAACRRPSTSSSSAGSRRRSTRSSRGTAASSASTPGTGRAPTSSPRATVRTPTRRPRRCGSCRACRARWPRSSPTSPRPASRSPARTAGSTSARTGARTCSSVRSSPAAASR